MAVKLLVYGHRCLERSPRLNFVCVRLSGSAAASNVRRSCFGVSLESTATPSLIPVLLKLVPLVV